MAMRTTSHNGRAGKKGVYSAKHNDRNFDPRKADHIDEERSAGNSYWHCYQKSAPDLTFEQAEARFYEQHFKAALDARNERNTAARHPERVRTMDEYRGSVKSCPEETIMQIGKAGETVDPALLWRVVVEHINWEQRTFPNVKLLDVAMHVDEQGAPHIHERKVWLAHDDQGREIVGQAKALQEMGIERPDMSKATGQRNNAKMSYTAACRDHLQEVAREHGLEIESAPLEHSKTGLALEEYQARQEQERAEQARQSAEQSLQVAQQAEQARQSAEMAQEMAERKAERAKAQAERAARERDAAQEKTERLQDSISHAREQKIDALRERDAARGDRDVVKALSGLQKAVYSPFDVEVDILAERDAKRSLTGREIPATVTISRDDFEHLQAQAEVNTRIRQAAQDITKAYKRMQAAAQDINRNRIDSFDVTRDEVTEQQAEQIEALRGDLSRTRQELQNEQTRTRSLSEQVERLQDKADTLDRLSGAFPKTIDRLQSIEQLERQFDRKGLSRSKLSEYAELCKAAGIPTRDDIQKAIERPVRSYERGLSL